MTFLTFQVGNGTKSLKKCLFRAGVLQLRETKILVDLNLALIVHLWMTLSAAA